MLQAIENFFSWFKNTIDTVWSFFEGFLNGLITLFKMIPQALNYVTTFIGSLPTIVQAFAGLTLVICVIYLILGRETGGNE